MGCTCIVRNTEQDYKVENYSNSLLRTNDGIKLKSGIKNRRNLLKMYSEKNLIDKNNFRKEVLEIINKYRKEHGVCPLEMNNEINNIAQKYAEHLSYIKDIDYSENIFRGGLLGESIYKSFKEISAVKLVNKWYEESGGYDFANNNPEPTHFSQMVWKSSKLFGLGIAADLEGEYFFVANYFPIGNIPGQFLSNVFSKNSKRQNENITNETNNVHIVSNDTNNLNNYGKSSNIINSNNTKIPIINNNDNSYKNNTKQNSNSVAGFNNFCIEALQSHNKYRNIHHSPPLKLNKDICNIAQNYADYLANNNIMEHSSNKYNNEPLGENLFMCYGLEATGEYATKSWYDEIKSHNFNKDYQDGTGHFTQVIWKGSKEVGFGISKNKKGYTYVVGNYYPPGNVLTTFRQNVLKA